MSLVLMSSLSLLLQISTMMEQHLKSPLKEKDKEIDSLHDIVNNLEVRLEHQEQYSRRTSLRFHNIDVPVDNRGHINFEKDT
jgi:hypothetical protein